MQDSGALNSHERLSARSFCYAHTQHPRYSRWLRNCSTERDTGSNGKGLTWFNAAHDEARCRKKRLAIERDAFQSIPAAVPNGVVCVKQT